MAIKAKLSQPFHDILTADDKDLILSTDRNNFKIFAKGETTLTVANLATGTKTITHNLGYHAAYCALIYDTDHWGLVPYQDTYDVLSTVYARAYTTINTLKIEVINYSGGELTYTLRYLIFVEKNKT